MVNYGYGYGIDLAQNLNYCAVYCLELKEKVRLAKSGAIRKFKDIPYPEVKNFLVEDLFQKRYPTYVCTDYTSEKSFSEELEAMLNPGFYAFGTDNYKKWKTVEPIVSTQDKNLAMKQNARLFMEGDDPLFLWPEESLVHPKIAALIKETKEQALRESAKPSQSGKWSFPKPEGQDNDLIRALELALYGAKKFYKPVSSLSHVPTVASGTRSNYDDSSEDSKENRFRNSIEKHWNKSGLNVTDVHIDY